MNTTIGKTFGLALLMAMGVVVTMLALGMFSVKPASATLGLSSALTVDVTPDKARSIGQYTITVTGASGNGMLSIPVGGTIIIKFNTSTTVPSSIAASAVKLKASLVGSGSDGTAGSANQLVSASAVTVSGKSVTITVPDMDPGTGSGSAGDNDIAADGGVTVTFLQAAGIQNPNLAKTDYTLEISTSTDTTVATSDTFEIKSFVSFSPSSGARGDTLTVTGGGFTKNCDDCKVRFNPQTSVTPTTGNEGSGSIDANGVFSGTVVLDSSTANSGWYIWVVDSTGTGKASSSTFEQSAGATPRSTSATPGSTVTVDLVDFTANQTIGTTGVKVGLSTATLSATFTINVADATSGDTPFLLPLKFDIPTSGDGSTTGTKTVTITDGNSKSATFTIEVVSRVLTVTPNPAAIGQSITISGTGFNKGGTIDSLTGSDNAALNPNSTTISIDSAGAWSFTTTMDTIGSSANRVSDSFTITAEDDSNLVGKSSGFKRTARTLTLSPSTGAPGVAVNVSVTGMTVDDGFNTTTATFTISADQSGALTLSGTKTFPIGSDGSGSGTITVPLAAVIGTITFTATDNAKALNDDATVSVGQIATANLAVPSGTLSVEPSAASTGQIVTITGSGFPPNSTATALTFGTASAIPAGGITSDAIGGFSVAIEIPAADTGGSLSPGSLIVKATLGLISGSTTSFSIPSPTITITPSSAAPEDIIVITGTGFNALTSLTTLDIGTASALPSPAPKAGRSGDITATVEVPLLNPGVYTVVMKNATGFTATGTFTAVSSKAPAAAATDATETIFADVIANDDNLVRVWRFSNADQSWAFYDPRPAFVTANTLTKSGAGDIVWVNVIAEQEFQGATLFPGWNLISLK